MSPKAIVGVDIGGTKILAGVLKSGGTVTRRVRLNTPERSKHPSVVEDTIVAAVSELVGAGDIDAVGVGAAGFVNVAGSTVRFSPHLSWRDEPLKGALAQRLGVPVIIDNDANTAAWAELKFGAGRGYRQMLCITLGTGIGGALVIDGQLFRGSNGMAGEFGHMQVVPDGLRCECGNRGCWEQYASGSALIREARELVARRSPAAHQLREMVEDDASRLSGPVLAKAAKAGDLASVEIFRGIGDWLGTGLASLAAAFDPEVIVIGGGVSDADQVLLDPAREALSRKLTGRGFRNEPPVLKAELGIDAGFIGAADLARRSLENGRVRRSGSLG